VIASASPGYILKRVLLEVRRIVYDRLGLWAAVDASVNRRITSSVLVRPGAFTGGLLAGDAREAARLVLAGNDAVRARFEGRATQAEERRLSFFGYPIPMEGPWPWLEDWVHGHAWPVGPAGSVDHFAVRAVPYDPKLPFELSRLAFIVQTLASALVSETDDRRLALQSFALNALADWDSANPLGHSVNWYAMEASVRGVALCQALDLARMGGVNFEGQALIARVLARCAHYTEINIERAVESNNHLIGNLTCLAAAGFALRDIYPAASRWSRLARRDLPPEIERQFHADGGNFEGSLPYHLATTDLALIADLIFERSGDPLPDVSRSRLKAACTFAAQTADLDGRVPIVGDYDESRHLLFDLAGPLDAMNVAAFGAAQFGCDRPVGRPDALISVAFLLGRKGLDALAEVPSMATEVECLFPDSGVIVIRTPSVFFLQDVGHVGQNGNGGHGHNDLSSFVFSFCGQPILTDRGTGVYTADPACRDRLRSSSSHSLLVVDEYEIADLGPTLFQIHNQAKPFAVDLRGDGPEHWRTHVSHTGYQRLSPPVETARTIYIDGAGGRLVCEDRLQSPLVRTAVRRFQFGPDIDLTLDKGGSTAAFCAGGRLWRAVWDEGSHARVEIVDHFYGYGRNVSAPCLVLTGRGADQYLTLTLSVEASPG
tara:strand:+ start:5408 stop:7384 length:1977 start_codon:yes stop_codon:yes gene_type:complete